MFELFPVGKPVEKFEGTVEEAKKKADSLGPSTVLFEKGGKYVYTSPHQTGFNTAAAVSMRNQEHYR